MSEEYEAHAIPDVARDVLLGDFIEKHRLVITEDNWPEWEAKGFTVTELPPEALDIAWFFYGFYNIYTGDGWDTEGGHPTRDDPCGGVYTNAKGRERRELLGKRAMTFNSTPWRFPGGITRNEIGHDDVSMGNEY
jgi:hypothetical protein